jgi:hypothetical protein
MEERDHQGLHRILQLFNIESKKEIKKYCRDLAIRSEDLFHIILVGRVSGLETYKYACHFSEYSPKHLNPTERDLAALSANGVGPLSRDARKTVTKISQIFQDRRMFSAHLFYTPSKKYWHLFYFDQRDVSEIGNHWKLGGPHIHYSRESFSKEPLDQVWRRVCATPPEPPSSVHVRYDYHHNRKGKHAA